MLDNSVYINLKQIESPAVKFYLDGVNEVVIERQLNKISAAYSIDVTEINESYVHSNLFLNRDIIVSLGASIEILKYFFLLSL